MQQFLDCSALVPKMGSTGGSPAGRVFVVVCQMHYVCHLWAAINLARQCNRTDIHGDNKAWFGVWASGVKPTRPNAMPTTPTPSFAAMMPTLAVHPLYATISQKPREQCVSTNCKGFTTNSCPYRLCASHCRLAGGCSKHKLPTTIHHQYASPNASQPLQSDLAASLSSSLGQYQPSSISEEEALTTALKASLSDTAQTSNTTYNSSSCLTTSVTAGSSSKPSIPNSPAVLCRPKISTQLGGTWLAVLDADDVNKVENERMALAKAEAASEAKKCVDVLWYDQVRSPCALHSICKLTLIPAGFCKHKAFHLSGQQRAPQIPMIQCQPSPCKVQP
jgi:hypothetical protein